MLFWSYIVLLYVFEVLHDISIFTVLIVNTYSDLVLTFTTSGALYCFFVLLFFQLGSFCLNNFL